MSKLRLYHGTACAYVPAILATGLQARVPSARWYTVAADRASAAHHAQNGLDAGCLLTIDLSLPASVPPRRWRGWPFLWPGYQLEWDGKPTTWWAQREAIPASAITKVTSLAKTRRRK